MNKTFLLNPSASYGYHQVTMNLSHKYGGKVLNITREKVIRHSFKKNNTHRQTLIKLV